VRDTDDQKSIDAALASIKEYRFERVGESFTLDMVAVIQRGLDANAFCALAERVWKETGKPLVLKSADTAALVKAAAVCGVKKFLTYGSGSEYDYSRSLCDVTEEQLGQNIPADITGFPKYLMNFIKETGLKMHNLRCFGVFGKYEDYTIRFISNAICRSLCDYSITIKKDRMFSYLYIDDLAEITEFFLNSDFCCYDYNITPNEKWSLLDIARLVRRVTLKDVPINVALAGMGQEYTGSNARLHRELNYTYTPMPDAVKMLVDWYVLNYDTIDKEKLLYSK
jgi:GDP-L-fucose synthase